MSTTIHRSRTWVTIPDNTTISQLMQDNISHSPPDEIIYEEAHTGKTVTYGVFHQQIRRTAYQIRQQPQFQPGLLVAISATSCIEYILVAQAVWWAGGVIAPVNNTLHPEELARAMDLLKPGYWVVDDSVFVKVPVVMEKSKHGASLSVFTIGENLKGSKWPPFPVVRSDGREQQPPPELSNPIPVNPKSCAAILLSSGTTGMPKAVMLSHYNLVATCYQLHHDNPLNWRGSQREIFFPPLSHVYALYVCFTMCCWLGAYVCLMPRFDLELYCRLMQDRRATLARIVPPVAKLLAESEVVRKSRYPCLEYFSCSAAPLHVFPLFSRFCNMDVVRDELLNIYSQDHTAKKLHEAFPGVALCQSKSLNLRFLHVAGNCH